MNLQSILNKRLLYNKNRKLCLIFNEEEINFIKNEIIKLNQQGISFTQISKMLNIERVNIRRWMKELNYNIVNEQNKLKIRKNLFEVIETEEDAYWLGFIYADGYIADNGQFEISLKSNDYPHLLKFANYCEFDKNKVKQNQKTNFKNSFRTRMSFATQQLKENFLKHGVVPRKSLILTFPTWLNESLYSHFIRGYFDGDGCICIRKNKHSITKTVSLLGTKEFLEVILNYFKFDLKIMKKNKKHLTNTYCIVFRKKESIIFLDFLYKKSSIYLDRKYNLYLQ
jgi:hypothetical protein